MRNGFQYDPKTWAWPPTAPLYWDIYNRNMYISGLTDSMTSGLFDSVSLPGTSGDQFRPGMRVENNFFYQGYLLMAAQKGKADELGPTGTMKNNVMQRFIGTNTSDNR